MKSFFLVVTEIYDHGAVKSAIFTRRRKTPPRDLRHRRPGIECEHRWFETREAAEAEQRRRAQSPANP